jgi:predicted RecA/RadA family phage recombinase
MRNTITRMRGQLALSTILALAALAAVVALMFVTGHLEFGSAAPLAFMPFVIGMATNEVYKPGQAISLAATDPAVPASGDPVLVGQLPGVSMTAERADGNTSVQTEGVFNLSVKGVITGPANSAVAVGDILYYTTGHTPKLDKDVGGVRFGYALGTLTSGSTGTIPVKLGY